MIRTLKKFLRRFLSRNQILLYHKLRALAANARYRFPARGMLVFGITGTKGKTTSCHFLASILEEAGYTVGMATTVNFQIGNKKWDNDSNKSVLPPEKLQKLIREMKDAGCNALVIEVTSHALDQYRLYGIPFRFVGFTNLTHDHLDYHKTWEHYRDTKLRLFTLRSAKAAAINMDDPSGTYYLQHAATPRRISFSTTLEQMPGKATDHVWADKISTSSRTASFTLHMEEDHERVNLQLPGRFNIENALCAAALALNLNVRIGTIVAGLQKLARVPGRLEKVETRKGFSVIIDYAHTPDSLEKLYATLRPEVRGRMIAVLGSCGDRDRTKRPIMGALAARFCDYVFVTDEEPYTEDPNQIIEEVAKGVPRGRPLFHPSAAVAHKQERSIFKSDEEGSGEGQWWWREPDRKEAIRKAVRMGKLDDVILVTGMGAQNFRIVGDHKEPWNDRKVIEEILQDEQVAVEV